MAPHGLFPFVDLGISMLSMSLCSFPAVPAAWLLVFVRLSGMLDSPASFSCGGWVSRYLDHRLGTFARWPLLMVSARCRKGDCQAPMLLAQKGDCLAPMLFPSRSPKRMPVPVAGCRIYLFLPPLSLLFCLAPYPSACVTLFPMGGWVSGGKRLRGQRDPALQAPPLACGDPGAEC